PLEASVVVKPSKWTELVAAMYQYPGTDEPSEMLFSSAPRIGLRPVRVGGPSSTNTIPGSVRLPRSCSSSRKYESANATRRSKAVRAGLSGEPEFGWRLSQNFSTNSARSASLASAAQAAVSSGARSHFAGPSAHRSSGFSPASGGAWNSSNLRRSETEP